MTFPLLILIGRPASGKSEIIDYLKRLAPGDRHSRFLINQMEVIDDFPMLWTWFEEDRILSHQMGQPRLHTDDGFYFIHDYLWHLLIRRLELEYHKRLRDVEDYHDEVTTILEFSRGAEHGGYTEAFAQLSNDVLSRAAILYVKVSYQESLRKNRRRFNSERPDSILEHGLPDHKVERLYKLDDWETLSGTDPSNITVADIKIPYVVFENEDDITSTKPDQLDARLEECLHKLWGIYNRR